MASMKVDNFLRPFRGRQDDFHAFWEKFLVLAKIQRWDDDVAQMLHLPLFLDGDAFLVFSKLADSDQQVAETVRQKLVEAFSVTPSAAYRLFVSRRLKADESPDAYVADLKRLLQLSGHKQDGDSDAVVVEQVIAGLPLEYARQLRMTLAGKKADDQWLFRANQGFADDGGGLLAWFWRADNDWSDVRRREDQTERSLLQLS